MDTMRLVIKLVSVVLSVGLPPAIADKVALRAWCAELLAALVQLAELTTIPQDDQVVRLLATVVADDAAWDAFYELLQTGGADTEEFVGAKPIAEKTGIDIAMIIAIAQAVIQLIELWRNRKS
jgi:hypothetical protein